MSSDVSVAEAGHTSLSLYRRPNRLRRLGALLLTASGALAIACGGGGDDNADDPGQVWVESDAANGLINLDDVQQAYRDAYESDGFKIEKFEQRVNEIYEGDNPVIVKADRGPDTVTITGWEDLDQDKKVNEATDDKLFTITQQLKDGGGFETQGHGANGYYHSSNPFGGFLTGLLIGQLFSGGFGSYATPPARYDTINSSRTAYRNSGSYSGQQARNSSYGSSVGSRFANAGSQSVSPARSSYQTRQISSGGFRSSGGGSRSISSGAKGGSGSSGGISGGGGRLRLA